MTAESVEDLRAQLAKLRAIRANGAQRVKVGERDTWFRTDAELVAAIEDLERRIAAQARPPVRTIYVNYRKGT